MIPIEDPAGGAASVFQDQTEGTPDQDADQIADVEKYGDHEQVGLVQYAGIVQRPDGRNQQAPEYTVKVGDANSYGMSVMELEQVNPASLAYLELAKEVLANA